MAALCFLCSCEEEITPRVKDPETQPTQISVDLVSTESRDGFRSYRMTTPLMERYELAKAPFAEFTKGIRVITYNDSTAMIESELTANYARFDEIKEVWEARGNVVGRNYSGDKTLFTEQLFWDQKADKIYSDKYVKVLDGKATHIGTGFESDGGFNVYTFRKPMGQIEMRQDTTSNGDADSLATTNESPRDGLPVYTQTADPYDKRRSHPLVQEPVYSSRPKTKK